MGGCSLSARGTVQELITDEQIGAIVRGDLRDPFGVLGPHESNGGYVIRVFRPDAREVKLVSRGAGAALGTMERVHPDGVFVKRLPRRARRPSYDLAITPAEGDALRCADPYSFGAVMSEEARYLFNEGNHQKIYEDLGSHRRTIDGVEGVYFAVWAPNAKRVSTVGAFNNWDGRVHQMRLLGSSGVWEIFIPGLQEGAVYKYEIKKWENDHIILKTDPYGYLQEPFPYHGSVVFDLDAFDWTDHDWMEQRRESDMINSPMSIYEVHLGSWKKRGPADDGDTLSYHELAHQLADYIVAMGFTHVELMPVQEHPYVPSWGYQVSGFYAPNHRFGDPAGFQYFVNHMHERGIGVIVDWVPGHFPKDSFSLAQFDGTHLYEHQDPREGVHEDWGTLIFNFGRHEVRNFLSANALFWLDKFHVDGLRVDAVASMLYRNYSRTDGGWIPNKYGGVENLEAVEFLQSTNYLVHERYPGAVTIAEESTAWPMVSRPTYLGGLGFTFKWNMGWMNDILTFFGKDPVYRKYHHNQVTFGIWYAFTENFILVLSHDEVVHGKGSLLEKMPGDPWSKFANVRCLYGFMFGHPGKKLLFMGGEFGMHNEWYSLRSIDWHTLESEHDRYHHQTLLHMVRDLTDRYRHESALWERDFENGGFSWIDHSDRDSSVIAFIRQGREWHNYIVFVCNFAPVVRHHYRIGAPHGGFYEEIFNSDAECYGGAGFGNMGGVHAQQIPWHERPYSLDITVPPLATVAFKWRR
jgi:1,4-alpha-glucan branching enzyme